jgi:hypothetical protein
VSASRRESGDQVADVVRAALDVPGVTSVRVEPDDDGLALLRLELEPGADEQDVARAVDARLRRRLGLDAPDAAPDPPPDAPEPPAGKPSEPPRDPDEVEVYSGTLPDPAQQKPTTGRTASGRRPVPPVTAPSVASTPAPDWLSRTLPEPPTAPAPSAGVALGLPERLVLERVQQVTEGMTTTSTVVLAQGGHRHTGVAEGAATTSGGHRSLAAATARALESAASGRLRLDVEAADLVAFADSRTAVVLLSVMTRRGAERLSGATVAGDDPGRAVVKAVLAACNRRVGAELVPR